MHLKLRREMGVKDADLGISQTRHLKPRPAERGLSGEMDRGGCSLRVRKRDVPPRSLCGNTQKGRGKSSRGEGRRSHGK